jgi:Putative zinc-finger
MDHKQAVDLQLAVKYVLGELAPVQRDEYEDHYMDCPECAKDVYAAAALTDTAREVFRQEGRSEAASVRDRVRGGWLAAWLRPVVAVPVFAALLLAVSYQSLVSVPHWKREALQASAPRVLPMYSLIASNSRGSKSQALQVRAEEPFGLYVDVPFEAAYTKYALRLEGPDGSATILRTVSYAEAQKTVVVQVTPEKAGAYRIVVLGLTDQAADPAHAAVLATMKFDIELGT